MEIAWVNGKRWEIRWVTWQDMGKQPLIVGCSWDINVNQSSFPTSADAPAELQSGSTISTSYHLTLFRMFGNCSGSSSNFQWLETLVSLNPPTVGIWFQYWCLAVRPPESFAIWPCCLHLLNLRWLWAEVENAWEASAVETTSGNHPPIRDHKKDRTVKPHYRIVVLVTFLSLLRSMYIQNITLW